MRRLLIVLALLAVSLVLASGGCAFGANQRAAHDGKRWMA